MAWYIAFSACEQGNHMATVERCRKLEAVWCRSRVFPFTRRHHWRLAPDNDSDSM